MLSFLAGLEVNGVQSETRGRPPKEESLPPHGRRPLQHPGQDPLVLRPLTGPLHPCHAGQPELLGTLALLRARCLQNAKGIGHCPSQRKGPVLLRVQEEGSAPPIPSQCSSYRSLPRHAFSRRKWRRIYSPQQTLQTWTPPAALPTFLLPFRRGHSRGAWGRVGVGSPCGEMRGLGVAWKCPARRCLHPRPQVSALNSRRGFLSDPSLPQRWY